MMTRGGYYNFKCWIIGIVLIGLLSIAAQCKEPKVLSFTLSSNPVTVNEKVSVQVNVAKNGHCIDDYRWDAEAGKIIGNGKPIITYQASENPGNYRISVELVYSGGTVPGSTMVEVLPEEPTPTEEPTKEPTPTEESTEEPTPTEEPTKEPTPTEEPTKEPTPTEEPPPEPAAVVVSPIGANLRDGPGTDYDTIDFLNNGTTLDIRGRIANNLWLQVIPEGHDILGWVACDLVTVNVVDLDTIPIVDVSPPPPPPVSPSDAVVVAPNGIALRSGPGLSYTTTITLPNSTTLDVLSRARNIKDWIENWIKVTTVLDSGEPITGYVNIAPGCIDIKVDLNDIPPVYEYGPVLYEPKAYAQHPADGNTAVTFKWQDYGVLEEHQYYSLIVVRTDLPDGEACYHWQTKEPVMDITFKDHEKCTSGVYNWGVGVATDLSEGIGDERIWRDDSERDHRRIIGLGVPPPDKPSDGGGDSSSSSSGNSGRTGELPRP